MDYQPLCICSHTFATLHIHTKILNGYSSLLDNLAAHVYGNSSHTYIKLIRFSPSPLWFKVLNTTRVRAKHFQIDAWLLLLFVRTMYSGIICSRSWSSCRILPNALCLLQLQSRLIHIIRLSFFNSSALVGRGNSDSLQGQNSTMHKVYTKFQT